MRGGIGRRGGGGVGTIECPADAVGPQPPSEGRRSTTRPIRISIDHGCTRLARRAWGSGGSEDRVDDLLDARVSLIASYQVLVDATLAGEIGGFATTSRRNGSLKTFAPIDGDPTHLVMGIHDGDGHMTGEIQFASAAELDGIWRLEDDVDVEIMEPRGRAVDEECR